MNSITRRIIGLIAALLIGGGAYGYESGALTLPGSEKGSSGSSETAAKTTACESPAKPITVSFSRSEYPNIITHIKESWSEGFPKILTINREGADERRDDLLQGIPTEDGFDRDEAPAASLRGEVEASVMMVPSSENRSAGASLGAQIAPYCDGTDVRYRFTP